jgi:hypothetical protein
MEIWQVVLSSALISGVVSALIGGWFSLRSKRNEYENAYYKLVLERRLAAYEVVEDLIISIKTAVTDSDRRPYHFLLSNDADEANVYKKIYATNMVSLWLTDKLFDLTRDLNLMVYGKKKDQSFIEFGKRNYKAIAELRTRIERAHAADMLTLHNVTSFCAPRNPMTRSPISCQAPNPWSARVRDKVPSSYNTRAALSSTVKRAQNGVLR